VTGRKEMPNRIGSCSCGGAWEVNRDRGYLYGEYRTDRPWHHFSFTNDPEGDGDFIEINVNFCPFCGEPQDVENVEEEQKEEPQPESVEPPQPEQPQEQPKQPEEPEKPQEPEVEEQPTYEWEEEEKSKTWIWILLAVLIAAGAGWYFFKDTGDTTPKDSNKTNLVEKPTDYTPVVEEEKSEPTTPLAFLEEFYKGKYENDDYVKQFVTANVLKKLKRDYVYDDPSGECLATWVFSAYPPGADWGMEAGPLFSKTNIEGKIKVDFKYYYSDGSHKKDYLRTVYLIVTEINGKYLISDYEVVEDNNQEDEQETKETEMPSEEKELEDGKYTLTDGYMFLTMTKEGSALKGFFYFSRGTYCSPSYDFSCTMGNDNRFKASTYITNTYQGEISGFLKGEIMNVKVNLEIIDKNNGERKLKVRK
jgi:hypothetical protein